MWKKTILARALNHAIVIALFKMFIPSVHKNNRHYYGQLIVLLNMTKYERTQHGNLNNMVARILKTKPGPRKAPPRRSPKSSMHSETLVLTISNLHNIFCSIVSNFNQGNALILPLLRLWEPTSSLKPSIKSTWVDGWTQKSPRYAISMYLSQTLITLSVLDMGSCREYSPSK